MSKTYVCPWWLIPTFDNPLRRLVHRPEHILDGLVQSGHTAVDIGCGIGYFTIPLARRVGPAGKVIAGDFQPEMLAGVQRRAERAGLLERIRLHPVKANGLDLDERSADFVLAFWMVHEVPDQDAFLKQVHALLKPGGKFLLIEPIIHVPEQAFQATVARALAAGLKQVQPVSVNISRAILFSKS